ncbi:5-beta-cholestane-3-alpha,7-alpha-diol 12-alpha-hydroxylase [Leucoraja erinacea]|uniref:5-beta-cholestane-3-alpha,7-alpha-diol 12-alpha-hydroxylase n=1 Tax=Leucoraja erinaceus TaxID=7782 RepID=UPI002456E0E4|nr:5-beta-cholestane-3-alpha,7-alpha-diol 12-alpha-hydroxylase [Leucoraja erinacea]
MAYALIVLCCVAILLAALLYLLGAFRRRRANEPPLDSGYLPWFGHVLSFRKNTAQFLQGMQKKHGDIFTVQIAGYYFTFVMDPLSYGAVVKESKSKLDFEKFAVELVARVFGYHAMECDHKMLEAVSNTYLKGDGLVDLTEAMMLNLQKLMLYQTTGGGGEWKQDGLFHYSYNIVFRAGYLALFGVEPPKGDQELANKVDREQTDYIFSNFRKYDRLFPRLAYAVLPPKDKLEAERLKRLFWDLLSVEGMRDREQISGWISERQRQLSEQGVHRDMQSRYMFLLLWASQGNTGPSAFWLLLSLCRCPEALRAVRAEVDHLLAETGQRAVAGGPPVSLTRDMLLKTPVLDSAVEESLRLYAAPMLIRAVSQDMELAMADGRRYSLRKGDRLALFPHLSAQMDPEIHPRPDSFQFDRFLNTDGTRKTDFYKRGQKVKYYNMPWGAGVSMCPGRFFATNELKQFIFLMLCYFDLELLNPEQEFPHIDISRWGFGTTQPQYDVQFRYRPRV